MAVIAVRVLLVKLAGFYKMAAGGKRAQRREWNATGNSLRTAFGSIT
jgi:hypothetical protein